MINSKYAVLVVIEKARSGKTNRSEATATNMMFLVKGIRFNQLSFPKQLQLEISLCLLLNRSPMLKPRNRNMATRLATRVSVPVRKQMARLPSTAITVYVVSLANL
jgi:hypothetical protein